jgi:hypothetical protein
MDTGSDRVAAAFPPMQERHGLRSVAGGRPQFVEADLKIAAPILIPQGWSPAAPDAVA